MATKYRDRYDYMRRFVAAKSEQDPSEISRSIYATIQKNLDAMHDELEPSLEDEFRFAMWAMVGAAHGASESFLSVDSMEAANKTLDVAEELAAIATTYFPRGSRTST